MARPRTSGTQNSQVVAVGGHRITLSNFDKVLYPATGTTKRDVLEYYAGVADVLIPHAANRAATRKRWVNGVGTPDHPGEMFFQKNLDDSTPSWVKRREISHKDHRNDYPLVNDLPTLIWLAQIAALEIHVPQWQFGRTGREQNPDRMVFDLDPGPGVGLPECAEVARHVRTILSGMGLTAMPVTSGSKGIHLYAALDGKQTAAEISSVAHELARALEADHPDLVVSDMKKSLREGKVLVDWSQNNGAKTTVVPYSLRGRFEPTVAAPRTWRELASPNLRQLDYREVLKRVAKRGDLLAALDVGPDRLATYRGMRSADKTPEPVPAARAMATDGNSFVIQEHHARRLHYDFRLEHDGVLVSWAVPKGVPTEPNQNHLAVQTEDHPLEYGTFEGTIPSGEYGAGTVSIWDAGTYELEKWRDGEEVIVTLHGRKSGGLGHPRTVALIHTGGGRNDHSSKSDQNWLIHLMKDQPAADPAATAEPAIEQHSSTATEPPAAMLATLGSPADIADEPEWAFEMKWDGIRAIASVSPGGVTLTSRNGHDLTAGYPELAVLADAVGDHEATLDGEIVALDYAGRPDFGRLQGRMNLTKPAEITRAMKAIPVHFMVFDILGLDGRSMVREPYDDRRVALESVVTAAGKSPVQIPPAFAGDLAHAIETSKTLDLEGVVAKRRNSTYQPGRRSRSWIKIKHHKTQEVVVVGWRPGNGRRASGIGSLLLGIPDGDSIRYVGRVGTGFSDRLLDDILARLSDRARATPAVVAVPTADARDAHWVRADLVAEVEFAEWTADGRLRQPVWRGWRPDKSAPDVRLE
jgi:bifunctional non-homologous end joining protein LigD